METKPFLRGTEHHPSPFVPLLMRPIQRVPFWWLYRCRTPAIPWHSLSPSRLLVNWETDYNVHLSFISQGMWACNKQPCLFKYLVCFCMPGFFWLSSVLYFSPSDREIISLFMVPPTPSRVHVMAYLSFSCGPLFDSLNHFDCQVPCREQKYQFGRL